MWMVCGCGAAETGPQDKEPAPSFSYPSDGTLRLQHLQCKSTHNSYHLEPEGNTLPDWAYSHLELAQQFSEQGVRHVELDIRYDYANEHFAVYHLKVIDEVTSCETLVDCLANMKSWSDSHPAHHPLVAQLEIKDAYPGDDLAEDYFNKLHQEVLAVWPRERLVTPADVRGNAATVGQAVRAEGWPTLGKLRGKLLVTIDNRGDLVRAYTHGGNDLKGRLAFPHSAPTDPYAAIAVLNDPYDTQIAAALAANMLVRTRADSGSVEPLNNDESRKEKALASGAHFVSTDFPAVVSQHDYWVDIPGGTPSRCNPVMAPALCASEDIEDPKWVKP